MKEQIHSAISIPVRYNFRILTLCFLFFVTVVSTSSVNAQGKKVSGTVKDASTGVPVPGSSVLVKGTLLGTMTNQEGKFSLSVNNLTDSLVVSHQGFEMQKFLIGYGKTRQSYLTGAYCSE